VPRLARHAVAPGRKACRRDLRISLELLDRGFAPSFDRRDGKAQLRRGFAFRSTFDENAPDDIEFAGRTDSRRAT
jgi:hypothetical protein